MLITYEFPPKHGDTMLISGWVVLVPDEFGRDVFRGVLPTKVDATEYAKSKFRSKGWRLLPCVGTVPSLHVCKDTSGVCTGITV